MSEDLKTTIADGVCEVQIARPQTKNSFLTSTYADFVYATESAKF